MALLSVLVSAGALALGAGAATSGGFDATVTCAVPVRAGIPVLNFDTSPRGFTFAGGKRSPKPATLTISSETLGPPPPAVTYLWVTSARASWGAAKAPACTRAPSMPLSRAGLPLFDTARGAADISGRCFAGTTMTARLRTVVSHGVATSARLLVRSGKRSRPLLYVDWTPTKIDVYATGDCQE